MANVLPPVAQKKVWSSYRARFVLVLALAIGILSFLLALALLPSYLALSFSAPPEQKASAASETQDDPRAILRAQILVRQFLPELSSTTSPREILNAALSAMPSGVVIDHISYTASKDTTAGSLMLVGSAPREKISAFRNALSTDAHFKSVSVPVAALVGNEGGHFSITMSLADSQGTQ